MKEDLKKLRLICAKVDELSPGGRSWLMAYLELQQLADMADDLGKTREDIEREEAERAVREADARASTRNR